MRSSLQNNTIESYLLFQLYTKKWKRSTITKIFQADPFKLRNNLSNDVRLKTKRRLRSCILNARLNQNAHRNEQVYVEAGVGGAMYHRGVSEI